MGLAGVLWWIGLAVVVVSVFPAVIFLALRIVKALRVTEAAALDIRESLRSVARGVPPAMNALSEVAGRCERLTQRVPT